MTADLYDLRAYRGAIQEKQGLTAPTKGLSPTQLWIQAHPRFLSDPQYNAAAMFAHYHALRCGFVADTTDYFQHIELFTGDRPMPEGCARPCDTIEHDGKRWLVWDVTSTLQPIVIRDGRKVPLHAGTWIRIGDAVAKALEELGR
jgi:hypothetical protein